MKLKIALATLLTAASLTVAAQEKETIRLSVDCWKTEVVVKVLQEEFKEKPILVGPTESGKAVVSVWINEKAKTSTTVISTKNGMSCVIGGTKDTKFYFADRYL